jgi:trk system potassium uptake protein TrkA
MTKTLFPSKRDDHLDVLSQVSLFHACSREELRRISALTTEITVEKGRVLCRVGDSGREAFIVVDGFAVVRIGSAQLATIGPGGFFGEMALLDGGPRVADVIATTAMRLLVLTRTELTGMLEASPAVGLKMMRGLGARLRRAETDGPIV